MLVVPIRVDANTSGTNCVTYANVHLDIPVWRRQCAKRPFALCKTKFYLTEWIVFENHNFTSFFPPQTSSTHSRNTFGSRRILSYGLSPLLKYKCIFRLAVCNASKSLIRIRSTSRLLRARYVENCRLLSSTAYGRRRHTTFEHFAHSSLNGIAHSECGLALSMAQL